ncbi:MAG TPA: hypothetical protein VMT52_01775 [Planctomycetota bacterium]|nr:hypothetical protein [Planctomycetota bacterium]
MVLGAGSVSGDNPRGQAASKDGATDDRATDGGAPGAKGARESIPRDRPASRDVKEPSKEVLQALRLLLSESPRDSARGARALERMGLAIAPQVRYWVRKVRSEADRVEILLRQIDGVGAREPLLDHLSLGEFYSRKLLDCQDLLRGGEYRQAADVAEALLLLDKNSPHAWDLRRIVRGARERLVRREVLEPSIEVDKLVYEVGEEPQVLFRLRNHEGRAARIRIQKGLLGEIDVSVTRHSMDGSMRRYEQRLGIEVPREVEHVVIGPGQVWDQRIPFELKDSLPLGGTVARVMIGGRFRPSAWTVDGESHNQGLALGETELWIVPPGESALCQRPLEKLTEALVFGKLESFFIGGQLSVWAGENDAYFNEKLIDTLLGSIEEYDATRLAMAARFLGEATGQAFETDAKKWKDWWAKVAPGGK